MKPSVNWQAYLDDSMSPSEREAADRALRDDPAAPIALENLRQFLTEIRKAGLAEEPPLSRLYAMVPKQPPARLNATTWRAATVGLAIAASMLFATIIPGGKRELVDIGDFAKAATWIREGSGVDVSGMRLSGAKLIGAERSRNAGCFCLSINGEVVHLAFVADSRIPAGLRHENVGGHSYLVGDGVVAFQSGNLIWMAKGDDASAMWAVAKEASAKFST